MICAGTFPAAVREVLSGGADFGDGPPVLQNGRVKTLTDNELTQVKQTNVTQVYFKECDLDRNNKNYKKVKGNAPYREGEGDQLSAQGFPKQCGNALGHYEYKGALNKSTNFIAEVFAKQTPVAEKPWFRAGIVHLVRKKRTVELNVICTDAVRLDFNNNASLFSLVMDFALEIARGQASAQSTDAEDKILVKYARQHAYGKLDARGTWASVGEFVTLEATTLGSMTKYMHVGFRFAPLVKYELLDATTFVGCDVNDGNESADVVKTYLRNCLKTQEENPDPARFTNALWGAMQALATFSTNLNAKAAIQAVQKAIVRDHDEFDPAAVVGTEVQRFTYATFALLTALTLLYAGPLFMLKDPDIEEETLDAIKQKGETLARDMRALFNVISANLNNNQNAELVGRMLEMARRVMQGSAIQMVKLNPQ